MLALRKGLQFDDSPQLRARLNAGAAYLLAHACADGGWNYGAPRALDRDARSYPETTGVALLALTGNDSPQIQKAGDCARRLLAYCQTSEGESWLHLGLLAHAGLPKDSPTLSRTPRTIQTAALAHLAEAAAQGRNMFLE
jgi:hypothetical protein